MEEGDGEGPGEVEEAPNIRKVRVGTIEAQGERRIVAKRRRVTIDSGAGGSVWPHKLGEDCRTALCRIRAQLEAAGGVRLKLSGNSCKRPRVCSGPFQVGRDPPRLHTHSRHLGQYAR